MDSVASSYGLLYIGVALACILYGITVLQTFEYYDGNREDGSFLKTVVAVIWVLDTVHVALIIHTVWFYLVQNFDNPAAQLIIPWSYGVQIVVLSLLGTIVEICYAVRLQRITRRTYLNVATIIMAVLHFVFDTFFTVKLLEGGTTSAIPPVIWSTTVSLALSVGADVTISIHTCHYLWYNRTGFSRTDTILKRLMIYAVNTGLLTTIFSLLTCILFAKRFTYLASLFYFSLSKFYANSLLATFNARQRLRRTGNEDMQSVHLSKIRHRMQGFSRNQPTPMHIQVDVARDTREDTSLEQLEDTKGAISGSVSGLEGTTNINSFSSSEATKTDFEPLNPQINL